MFGFGSPTGLQTSQEASGLIPDPKWKETQIGESWYLGNTYHFGIGQGDVLVTPIQIASMTQAIANHGSLCQSSLMPTLKQNCRDLAIDAKNLEIVLSGMLAACSQGGTAYPLFPHNTQIAANLIDTNLSDSEKIDRGMIACKTGTAEFGVADERGYRKTHAWTTAIVGIDSNKIASSSSSLVANNLVTNTSMNGSVLDREQWQNLVKKNGFPSKLIFTVLVESDTNKIYSEGSQDAAPVIKQILDGMILNDII
jgi:cell division protein FtsI/penicillin-binding protein 2